MRGVANDMFTPNFRIGAAAPSAMAGETGEGREGPSPPGPSDSISWRGPGGTQYIYKEN